MKKLLLLILALVLISGCATNECVDDLDVLNNIFGIEGARLVSLYNQGKYHPYAKEDVQKLIIKIMKIIPNY